MKIMMTQMMTKMMTTHHRSGQLNAVLFPHLESLAKVDYLDVVFLLQKIFMSSIEEGNQTNCHQDFKSPCCRIECCTV